MLWAKIGRAKLRERCRAGVKYENVLLTLQMNRKDKCIIMNDIIQVIGQDPHYKGRQTLFLFNAQRLRGSILFGPKKKTANTSVPQTTTQIAKSLNAS
jgi:hypothetical protein